MAKEWFSQPHHCKCFFLFTGSCGCYWFGGPLHISKIHLFVTVFSSNFWTAWIAFIYSPLLFFPRVYPAGFAKAIVKSLPSIRWERRTFDLEAASLLLKAENKVRTGAPKLWTKKKHPTLLGLNLLPIKSPLSNPQGRYYHLFAKSSDSVVVDSLGRCGSEAMSSVRVWSEAAECSIWLVGLSYFSTAIEAFFRLGCAIFRRSRWLYTYQRGCCVEWSLPLHLQTIGNGICNHVWECLGMEFVKTNWNLYQIVFFAKSERAKIPDERAKIPDERAKKKWVFSTNRIAPKLFCFPYVVSPLTHLQLMKGWIS